MRAERSGLGRGFEYRSAHECVSALETRGRGENRNLGREYIYREKGNSEYWELHGHRR